MVRPGIREAVVLAAGNGSRMASLRGLPKPLTPIAGATLLECALAALPPSIQLAHVVIGYCADQIRSAIGDQFQGRSIDWIHNPFFPLPNGVSLFSAKGKVASPFLLVMCDHLFARGLLNRFCAQECPSDGGLLAVDRKIDQVFDLPDAMKVELREDAISSIGKDLDAYDAIDTGAFLLSSAVFDAFVESSVEDDLSLAGAIRILARQGRMRVWDIGPSRWIDVDTPEAYGEAERLLKSGHLWNGAVECKQCFGATSRTA